MSKLNNLQSQFWVRDKVTANTKVGDIGVKRNTPTPKVGFVEHESAFFA